MKENKTAKVFIIGTFVLLYTLVSIISTIHVVDFFRLSNPEWLAITLAIAFEVGAAASLASIVALRKMNKTIVWGLFVILTIMQAMGNTFYAYTHLTNYQSWIELFGLVDEEIITQKRILSLVSGAILPIVALGFVKSLVDYLKPEPIVETNSVIENTGSTELTYNENDNIISEHINDNIVEESSDDKLIEEPEVFIDDDGKEYYYKDEYIEEDNKNKVLNRIKVYK